MNDAVQRMMSIVPPEELLEEKEVGMHEQRLAASGRHPERQLVQQVRRVPVCRSLAGRFEPVAAREVPIQGLDGRVQLGEQPLRIPEPEVQVDVCCQ